MNKYFVIGNPINHSLSPQIHNYWFNKYKFFLSNYEKKNLEEKELDRFVKEIRDKNLNINGVNVTVPYKNKIIPFLDELSSHSLATNSVNTIFKKDGKLIGHNTDTIAFEETIKKFIEEKSNINVLLIGAGGVSSSILLALCKLLGRQGKIHLMNRTKNKAMDLKKLEKKFNLPEIANIEVIDWGEIPDAHLVINTTSLGLKKKEHFKLDFTKYEKFKEKTLFYDLIYNPKETNFLTDAKKRGNKITNGKMMFLLQAKYAFQAWTGIDPEISEEVIKILD